MALKKLLNKGTVYKRSDNRWGGMVSYHDEQGVYRRKSFCAPTKKAKIGDYIEFFKMEIAEADETKKPLRKSMQKWLEVFQYGTVERATYDRKEDCAKHYIYPRIGDMIISEITSADLNGILTQMMNEGYSHSTVKMRDIRIRPSSMSIVCSKNISAISAMKSTSQKIRWHMSV